MAIVEDTPRRMVLRSGSLFAKSILILDKDAGRARFEHSVLMWSRKPTEIAFGDIADVAVATMKDPLSGSEVHSALMRLNSGNALAVPASETEVVATVERVRGFLGLGKAA